VFQNKLEKLYIKRQEQTKSFMYTLANKLYKNFDLVSMGDYTPHGGGLSTKMRRAMNNQSLIGRFKLVLNWVAKKSGKHFHEWNEKGSTRTCHACGFKHESSLSPEIREWSCPWLQYVSYPR
jgi:putative transposase